MSENKRLFQIGGALAGAIVLTLSCSDATEGDPLGPQPSSEVSTGHSFPAQPPAQVPSGAGQPQTVSPTAGAGVTAAPNPAPSPGSSQPVGVAPSEPSTTASVTPSTTVTPPPAGTQTNDPSDTTTPPFELPDDSDETGGTMGNVSPETTTPPPGTSDPTPEPSDSTNDVETTPGADTNDDASGLTDDSTDDATDDPTSEPPPPVEDIDCPADATFCTGFEVAVLPAEASFEPKHIADVLGDNSFDGRQLALDTQIVHSGTQALHVPAGSGGYEYRMLAVPVPSSAFWVRLYVRTSTAFGDGSHDTLYMGSRLPKGEYNGDTAVEISEQSMQLLLNTKDSLYAASGPGDPAGSGASGPVLPANTWICMETRFDANAIEVYADGELLIQADNYGGAQSYQTFRFGYLSFNDARSVWYDDVVVASDRIGCN